MNTEFECHIIFTCHTILFFFGFFCPRLKNAKTYLAHKSHTKQAEGWIWPINRNLPGFHIEDSYWVLYLYHTRSSYGTVSSKTDVQFFSIILRDNHLSFAHNVFVFSYLIITSFFFWSFVSLPRTFKTILNSSDDRRHLCLIPDFNGTAAKFHWNTLLGVWWHESQYVTNVKLWQPRGGTLGCGEIGS